MMDNNNQWKDLLKESVKYPDGLSNVEERLENRIKKGKRKGKGIISSITAAAAAVVFILLVNYSPAFADTIAEIPVLGQIADFVRFDKSLSKAIQNDYVQEVGLVALDGDRRLLLPYVIADEKNLVLFFQLPEELEQGSDEWVSVRTTSMKNADTGEKVDGYAYSTGNLSPEGKEENFGFIKQDYQFVEKTVPKAIDLEVELKSGDSVVGTFGFNLELEEFSEPKVHAITENHTISGQSLLVEDISVYPAGTEVNVRFSEENSAIIKGLELLLIQSNGEVLQDPYDGISATYDDTWMRVFIESNYFDAPEKQELHIRGVRLLDKDELFITVDMDSKTMTPAIKGTELTEVIQEGDHASLVFTSHLEDEILFSMFATEYSDEEGNHYELDGVGTGSDENTMKTYITVKYPDSGKIILERQSAPMTYLEKPVIIPLPAQ